MDTQATGPDLLRQLPPPLPVERIVALNQPKGDLHTTRAYEWNGWTFDVPPGVFLPGETSRMVHERILDGRVETRGLRYGAMGAGLGVEAVAAGVRGAREIYAMDVHTTSVATAARHYARLVGPRDGTAFLPAAGDLFDGLPPGTRLDVVTFNPPAVSQAVSEDPDVVRNTCVGSPLLARFFAQLAERELLAPDGVAYVIASNTADLRRIVQDAQDRGFTPRVDSVRDWRDGVLTFLFAFTRGGRA
ncbi:methyltransferase [Streptomyces spectabilis]|uniref:Methyltransferase n=1 Tax=Streptomyces spectabilis TaxID=68270 RepID=A0A516R6U4_STRST|nr:methyltransferase [Streptomyces spectabilis]QDQ11386.1 methyltransferase [Streptomyces spectabilis]